MYLFGTLRHTGVFRNRQRGEVVLISYSALTFKTILTHFYKVPTIIQINIILIVTCSMSHGSCHVTSLEPPRIRWKTVSKAFGSISWIFAQIFLRTRKIKKKNSFFSDFVWYPVKVLMKMFQKNEVQMAMIFRMELIQKLLKQQRTKMIGKVLM